MIIYQQEYTLWLMRNQENESKLSMGTFLNMDPRKDYRHLLSFTKRKRVGILGQEISRVYSNEGLIKLLGVAEQHIREVILPRLGENFDVVKEMITPKKDLGDFNNFGFAYRAASINYEEWIKFGFSFVVGEFLGAIEINLCNERVLAEQRRKILRTFLDIVEEDMQVPIDRNILRIADGLAFTGPRMLSALKKTALFPRCNTFHPSAKVTK